MTIASFSGVALGTWVSVTSGVSVGSGVMLGTGVKVSVGITPPKGVGSKVGILVGAPATSTSSPCKPLDGTAATSM
jgi:hypothetical protein